MNQLPPSVQKVLEGKIDPKSQYALEQITQIFLIALTVVSFVISFFSSSVIFGLEVFLGGLVLLILVGLSNL
uniref:Uncharacterized protein n=1 Tax=Kwoniella pini CBS 10737 TaxID=1296096 RepID=A0A1B9I9T6_9TREE|nr:uncharacterized protein I206_01634 [Kwoniella pini CBS 10737]OCF52345.1 hypothetical protein I206_01634 [Kwoniella pini CBS 10737]